VENIPSSPEFFVDVAATIDDPYDGYEVTFDCVEDDMSSDDRATNARPKAGSLAPDKWKPAQFVEFSVYTPSEVISRIRIPLDQV
jgi:hypothetical protein